MTCTPSRAPSSASAPPTRAFKSSDSTTHGPAMRNGAVPKCCGISVVASGELGRSLRVGKGGGGARGGLGAALLAGRAHEPGEQRVRPGGAGLELGVELAAHEPRVIRQLDHLDE